MKWPKIVFVFILSCVYLFFPNKIVQFIAAFLLLTQCFAFIYSRILQKGITVDRPIHNLKLACFENLELTLILENRSFLPVPSCFLCDSTGGLSSLQGNTRWLVPLRARERVLLSYTVSGNKRGETLVGPLKIRASDPLGLFPFERIIESYCTVLIRPARINLSSFALKTGIPQGTLPVHDKRYEDVTLYRSVRDYAPGDELRRINWKSSARFGRLFTNEYQDSLNSPVFVFLNLSVADYSLHMRHYNAELAIEVAAALVRKTAKKRQHCGFASTGTIPDLNEFVFLQSGASLAEPVLDILAKISLADGNLNDTGLLERSVCALPFGTHFFYVGPILPMEHFRVFFSATGRGIAFEFFFTEGQIPFESFPDTRIPMHQVTESDHEIRGFA